MSDAGNADQIAYWNETGGLTWASLQERLDRQIDPLGQRAIAALEPKPGERVLDIGCGCGQTSLELAEAVGPGGAVTGLDISRPMLKVAADRARAAGAGQARFIEADAQVHAFEPASVDAVFSRFGVMFFSDPTAAFANIRTALRPGGRMAFVCWRTMPENAFMALPLRAALAHVPPPPPPQPGALGPFAFADAERLRGILAAAGFTDIAIVPHDQKIGSGDLEQTLALSLKIGPLGAMLRENPDRRDQVVDAVRDALRPHEEPEGVMLDAAAWIVTARAP